jgi:hypothetical protein
MYVNIRMFAMSMAVLITSSTALPSSAQSRTVRERKRSMARNNQRYVRSIRNTRGGVNPATGVGSQGASPVGSPAANAHKI